jgi:hypothetical protein
MAIKTIKKANTLTGLVISILLGIGFFTGMFLFWNYNATESGQVIDSKYNNTYTNLTAYQTPLDNNVQEIRNAMNKLTSADNTWQVAWNGFIGLGQVLKLPISMITTALGVYSSLEGSLDIVPSWVTALIFIGITAVIVFLILSNLKGEQGKL